MSILVTGGAGFIGSHTCVELLNAGYDVIVLDNYYNSQPESLKRIKKITGKDFKFYEADIRHRDELDKIFSENKIDAVIHFAGLKAVGESCVKPLEYYENNVGGTVTLCEAMRDAGIAYAVDQIIDLVAHGVDGIHLYTMNNPYVARKITESIEKVIRCDK